MSTEREELFYAPTFGLQPQIGKSTANVNQVKNALSNNIVNLVERDPRFSQVISLNVTQIMDSATSGFLVKLVVKLAGTGTAIPVSFAINSN